MNFWLLVFKKWYWNTFFWKGVSTMVASGCTVYPPSVYICIQCGWYIFGVNDRYLKYDTAGDQYVGQCDTIKEQLSKTFSTITAYFDSPHIDDPEKCLSIKQSIKYWIWDRLLGISQILPKTSEVVMVCFLWYLLSLWSS